MSLAGEQRKRRTGTIGIKNRVLGDALDEFLEFSCV